IVCKTTPYQPAIFTSAYDNTVGQPLASGAAPGRYFQALATGSSGDQLHDIRISYARYAIHGYTIGLKHAQITHCDYAFSTDGGLCRVGNVLVEDVATVFAGFYFMADATHL